MTAAPLPPTPHPARRPSNLIPMLVVAVLAVLIYWPLMLWANAGQAARSLASGADLGCGTALQCATQLRNPVIPAPGQFASGFASLSVPPFVNTAAPYNALVTGGETLLGLALASLLGLLLATLLVGSRSFERATLPWLVASQTVPIVALAPMLAVLLGQYGVQGFLPKAIIAAYIAFFPVAIGMAQGLTQPRSVATGFDANVPRLALADVLDIAGSGQSAVPVHLAQNRGDGGAGRQHRGRDQHHLV